MERVLRYVYLILFLFMLVFVVSIYFGGRFVFETLDWLFWAITGGAITSFIIYIASVATKNPTTLPLAIVGHPISGKTVYLSILFNELSILKNSLLKFAPSDNETIEQVASNLSILLGGNWLPATLPGITSYFRGNITLGTEFFGLLKRRYNIEIADYAGEHTQELIPESERWIHKTDFFKRVIQSDGVLWAIDLQLLLRGDRKEIEDMQNKFIAAVQVLAAEKGGNESKKVSTPFALLFMKADLIQDNRMLDSINGKILFEDNIIGELRAELKAITDSSTQEEREHNRIKEEEIKKHEANLNSSKNDLKKHLQNEEGNFNNLKNSVKNLIDICEQRFQHFSIFRVSSIGEIGPESKPPQKIQPNGVIEPLSWILDKIR